ncbi:MAG: isoleucine--tRNA ligase [Eubacteriales bacterium]|jgi:isoleucyl-tRNA synthetase
MSKDYTSTLNLPQTNFPMRANLPEREPQTLKSWEDIGLYNLMLKNSEGCEQFILHDGPPFSNGDIHMGTALNKCLKDFINKSKAMEGKQVVYIPGWDNHGLPIESAIIKQNRLDRNKTSISEFRDACRTFAENFVNRQREQFKRLGVLGDWEHPYLTMDPEFEACEVRVFGKMYQKGCIYKGLKPVYWCPHDETALAEAEIEYQTDKCDSVYVKFRVIKDNDGGKLSGVCDLQRTYFIIWTTTIWTLPGNIAIALNPDVVNYSVVEAGDEYYIVAEDLVEKTMAAGGISEYRTVLSLPGRELEFVKTQHPFLDRESVVVLADYVTTDSGTGCVHTAPGFGVEDWQTCIKYGIETIVPVDDRGYQTAEAGKYAGLRYDESNLVILADMKESGALFAHEAMEHEYPHCWRCKEPVIFRATPQWFCSVDSFKNEAIAACEEVEWLPSWGLDRIKQMVRERADWCISRQRHWGLPIPVFYCNKCGKPVCTHETTEAVANLFAERGSNSWYETEACDILPEGFACPFCGGIQFTKETDTLDCWFDSGVTHFAVLENGYHPAWPKDLKWPADMYLEGADQYRGWFQSSLLTAVSSRGGSAPYRTVLTHGWTVDGEGHAMHKSLGNTVAPEDMIKKYGAELVRLWAASSDYKADVRVSDAIFRQLSEIYRKIRNTARILLANIGDFDPETDMVSSDAMVELDRWILARLDELIAECRRAYDDFEFHIVYHATNNFCTIDLSKLYIDITKDRVYTSAKDSHGRRSAQSAMYLILSAMTRLMSPIISFTAEEIWQAMPHTKAENKTSVFLNRLPEATYMPGFEDRYEKWNRLFDLRDDVMKALELARADKLIGKSLDAKVTIYADGGTYSLLEDFADQLATVFIVSGASVVRGGSPDGAFTETASGIGVLVALADGEKCDRCWMYSTEGEHIDDSFVCSRCLSVIRK